jgi:heat-inducible transcriptional repressor
MVKVLSSRKQKIIKAVVDEYIKRAQPVSSGEIQTKYFSDISSATVRAELSTLEDMGYLAQPHTSAGRIPSPLAYRYYVENFLPKHKLNKKELQQIDASFNLKFNKIQQIVKTAAKVISDITNYTSVIVFKNINKVLIKEVKIVTLEKGSALVVIITDSGIIKDKIITLKNASQGFVADAEALINKIFANKTVGQLKAATELVEKELGEFKDLLDSVMQIIINQEGDDDSVYLEGESKLLNHPEASLECAKNFLTIIDDKKALAEIVGENQDIEFSVKIGKDETGGIEKYAIVTAKYTVGGKELARAGVIGPERMDYSRVMSVLSYVGETINTIVDNNDKKID